MTDIDKMKVWVDYMVTQVELRHSKVELSREIVDTAQRGKFIKRTGADFEHPTNVHYRDFVSTQMYKNPKDMKIKSMDEFFNGPQDIRMSECFEGWYWRFKDRIKL